MTGLELALGVALMIALSLVGHCWVRIGELGQRIHQQNDAAINQAIRHNEDMTTKDAELADAWAALEGAVEENDRLNSLLAARRRAEQGRAS